MQKILFIELLGGIGDVVIALSAIHALALTYPEAELTVLTFRPGNELLKSDPLIKRVICAESGKAKQSVIELLSRETFDLIVSDTNYEDIDKVILNSSASQKVTNLWRQPPPDEKVGDRFVKILQAEGLIGANAVQPTQIYLTHEEINKAQEQFVDASRPIVFLCPDAGMGIKRWFDVNFITLGQILQKRWNATMVVPVGSDEQQALAIAKGIGGEAQIFPRGKLRDFAATLACGDLVIASDTGPARIAAALNVLTITLFGPSWHGRYGQPSPHVNLQGYPECSERNISNFTVQKCWYSGACPLDKGWQSCMEGISVDEVLAVVEEMFEPQRR
ncbi:glycosyl transferase [Scytonema sp. UIC 10036]|uniref:glycosyltransferase family 9 protein n=1 Tax=Scytonema sp. UIC 10036 TaxID=2304196 RepID=UPI0012DA3857|nr:glycosyltransferase family 9 protein [Scytonema sp. UIC 10036]MUG93356.1 glycosyl transferase [Scytonema sp. UIC 10036]